MDNSLKLFKFGNDEWVTVGDIRKALKDVKADDCKLLFVHSELSFGVKNPEIKRNELCKIIVELFLELNVETVMFPTFTFSYGNQETFDILNTPSRMGMLTEYVRKMPESERSLDPMMSVVVIGNNKNVLNITGEKSLGKGSIFDNLHNIDGVKFVFFGTAFGECGTHMHYVEEALRVPYRYDMEFEGTMIDKDGNEIVDKRVLYVKYQDIKPCVPKSFETKLVDDEIMLFSPIGNTGVYSITETDMFKVVYETLSNDVNAFLAEPYDTYPPVKNYQYGNVTTVQ